MENPSVFYKFIVIYYSNIVVTAIVNTYTIYHKLKF